MQTTTSPIPTTTSPTTTAPSSKETRNLYLLLTISLISILLLLTFSSTSTSPSPSPSLSSSSSPFPTHQKLILLSPNTTHPNPISSIAYLITGSDGDLDRLLRLVFAIYHPKNQYLLHLDLTASGDQRDELALRVEGVPVFRAVGNVNVIGKADFANPKGVSAVSATLHGAAILLKYSRSWDWFVNLDAAHYPLITQDDLLHILSYLPKDLNFVNHTSYIGWRESHRMKPIVVDPGLYLSSKSEIFYATQRRELPNAYRMFTGSPSAILSRKFIDYCILGSDNLPRTALMYFSNMPSSQANYFQTVVCNSQEFNKTVVNHNLQYESWDTPPKLGQHVLGLNDFGGMVQSGAAFGSRFLLDDPVLDRIDLEILNREPGKVVSGGWCLGEDDKDPCTVWGDADILRPGAGARRLEKGIVRLLSNEAFHAQQCIID
ncbi:hypothetical protein GIB67_010948 [Kingdonia uniflora]|uniref:Uncharacterized protein n=1 Tax=Kingdonia uniflora TaxID=39325 RepID=A0A7J7NVK5_9MAGN|nr:hypothetical protein GIB67_010948 [Kingdonia uniflora]